MFITHEITAQGMNQGINCIGKSVDSVADSLAITIAPLFGLKAN